MLLSQIQIGHDFMVVDELLLRALEGGEHVIGFIDHFEAVVQFSQIELDYGIVGVLLERLSVRTDDFVGLPQFEKELLQAVKNDDTARLGIDFLENFNRVFVLPSRTKISPMPM